MSDFLPRQETEAHLYPHLKQTEDWNRKVAAAKLSPSDPWWFFLMYPSYWPGLTNPNDVQAWHIEPRKDDDPPSMRGRLVLKMKS